MNPPTQKGELEPEYSLIPRPHPAFCRLQYEKWGEPDVINKRQKKIRTKK